MKRAEFEKPLLLVLADYERVMPALKARPSRKSNHKAVFEDFLATRSCAPTARGPSISPRTVCTPSSTRASASRRGWWTDTMAPSMGGEKCRGI